jgi:hypothetical protein
MKKQNPPPPKKKKKSTKIIMQRLQKNGGGCLEQSKYLAARMNLRREMIEEKCALAMYTEVLDMKANGFSKPYDKQRGRIMQTTGGSCKMRDQRRKK